MGARRCLPTNGRESSARWVGGRLREGMGLALYAGPMSERTNGLVPTRSKGTKPTMMLNPLWSEKLFCTLLNTENTSIITLL